MNDYIEFIPGLDVTDEVLDSPLLSGKPLQEVRVWRVSVAGQPGVIWRVRAKQAPNFWLAHVKTERAFIAWLNKNAIEIITDAGQ